MPLSNPGSTRAQAGTKTLPQGSNRWVLSLVQVITAREDFLQLAVSSLQVKCHDTLTVLGV